LIERQLRCLAFGVAGKAMPGVTATAVSRPFVGPEQPLIGFPVCYSRFRFALAVGTD
jgi:hypothetical protein